MPRADACGHQPAGQPARQGQGAGMHGPPGAAHAMAPMTRCASPGLCHISTRQAAPVCRPAGRQAGCHHARPGCRQARQLRHPQQPINGMHQDARVPDPPAGKLQAGPHLPRPRTGRPGGHRAWRTSCCAANGYIFNFNDPSLLRALSVQPQRGGAGQTAVNPRVSPPARRPVPRTRSASV